ncbi:MAG: hypothetical protein LBU99_06915 [Spirochaetaceae bacterium]|jgi:adenylate kinase family enzyme|nr:hypothetical protein [Spirochaetaceae bacterium]
MKKAYILWHNHIVLQMYKNTLRLEKSHFSLVFVWFPCYILYMSITQTVEIPISHRLTIDVPSEIPVGRTILTFTPAAEQNRNTAQLPGDSPDTIEEALLIAAEKASDPNRKPISRLFGKCKGIFGGDGVAYQRAIRDEWD